ncbi:hypothetical protein SAMN06273572_11031 [Monaibacterium marinum]|uniref:Histidine kinase n=1 Tax=Pontivivens marinum TaxID=1690039 RepID=A0A2C9CVX7_9RHOB|nr:DUF6446 family protein [Monaibacterium marinum]SOH95360.1 hypothetical protein SAMN06273572_11031 [Monaibacterium marinum]
MNGKWLVGISGVAIAALGIGMYYAQVYAYYEETQADSVQVAGVTVPVADWQGIDANTSPNKLRACFTVDPQAFADVALASDPQPLLAPDWFDCFDGRTIGADLESGAAVAYLAEDETDAGAEDYEILRMIAVYPDGRAYMWRHYRES